MSISQGRVVILLLTLIVLAIILPGMSAALAILPWGIVAVVVLLIVILGFVMRVF